MDLDDLGTAIGNKVKRIFCFGKLKYIAKKTSYPKDQKGYLTEYIDNMRPHRIEDLLTEKLRKTLIDKVVNYSTPKAASPKVADKNVLEIFSDEALYVLKRYAPD